jgi:hypothetical protein
MNNLILFHPRRSDLRHPQKKSETKTQTSGFFVTRNKPTFQNLTALYSTTGNSMQTRTMHAHRGRSCRSRYLSALVTGFLLTPLLASLPVGLHAVGGWDPEQDLASLALAVSTLNNWAEP